MAWVDDSVVWEGVELFDDAGHEEVVIAVREVGAPDSPSEKGVSGDEDFFLGEMKAHRVGRVAGNVEELDFEFSDLKSGLPFQEVIDFVGINGDGEAPLARLLITDEVLGVVCKGIGFEAQFGDVFNVIKMLMSEDEGFGAQLFLPEEH